MAIPTAHSAKYLAAASLLRAYLADDKQAGILIIEQNGGQALPPGAELTRLIMAVTKLGARCLLSANGYDPDKTLKVVDGWLARLAGDEAPPP